MIVSNVLGTWDMSGPLQVFTDILNNAYGTSGSPESGSVDLGPLAQLFGIEGTTTCSKKTYADGNVPVCAK